MLQTIKNAGYYCAHQCGIFIYMTIENPVTCWMLALFNIWSIKYMLTNYPIINE